VSDIAHRDAVLVTGAGSGFGLATALHLAEGGMRVYGSVLDEREREALAAAARERGVEVRTPLLDVTDHTAVERVIAEIVAECGGIYGVVNNAGLGLRGFFEDISAEEISRLFEVNLFGAMAVTRAALPHMRSAKRGRVVLVSSAGGRIAAMTISAYCASKFALAGFGEALALEMKPLGIGVSLIEPGLVMTPHFTVNRGQARAAVRQDSPYRDWFVRHEQMVDGHLKRARISVDDVARAVGRALTDRKPRLHYVVGRLPRILISLQRHLPGELFRRLYERHVMRQLTVPRRGV
jgi:NAD(P)-dependent dehydrogenase (short-subunit alcohol dehydrogenase family)